MNPFVDTLRGLGPARLAIMAAVAAGIFAFFIYLTSRLTSPDLALLYGDLDSPDSAQIATLLDQQDVPYSVSADGSSIKVPSDQVGRLRVAMAEQGLPSGGSIGYELFDRSEGLGTTNFVQNINHVRALEGELSRTIRSIGQVQHARVHLVLPRRELFSRERQEPSASIVVSMRGNRRLDREQVLAIQHLVAAAVPGLQPIMVSLVDNKGNLLARGADADDAQTMASNAEDMRRAYENRLARTIEALLERSVGPGNVRAEVAAEMDFDRITENTETYDPDGQVVRSTQVVEETSASTEGQDADAVTVGNNLPDANLPGLDGGGSSNNAARTEETTNYEISRTVTTHVREAGMVQRLSVAVLVNGSYSLNDDDERIYAPRSDEELTQLEMLVRSTVGFDEERGDIIEVVNMEFVDLDVSSPVFDGSFGFLGLTQADLMRLAEVLVLGIVAILVLLLVVRPLVGKLLDTSRMEQRSSNTADLLPDPTGLRPALAGPELPDGGAAALMGESGGRDAGGGQLPSELSDGSGEDLEQMIDLNKVEGRVRSSTIRKIGEIVEKHPEEAVAILRNWLYQET